MTLWDFKQPWMLTTFTVSSLTSRVQASRKTNWSHGDALSSLESSPSASTSRPLPPWRIHKRLRNALNGCTEERLHACTLSVSTGSITRRVCPNGYMRFGDCWNSILKTEGRDPHADRGADARGCRDLCRDPKGT